VNPINTEQRQFIDIFARMIDAPTEFRGKQHDVAKNLDEQLKQLPWALETAILKYLYGTQPDWFKEELQVKFKMLELEFKKSDETIYYGKNSDETFELLDYKFAEKICSYIVQPVKSQRQGRVSSSIDAWCEKHGLYESSGNNPDPHFAERAFIINILVPYCGEEILQFVKPQFEIVNPLSKISKRPYKIDFVIESAVPPVAIEIDGAEYHDPERIHENTFEHQLERQNFILAHGFKLLRFPARKILVTPEECIRELKSILKGFTIQKQSSLFGDSPQNAAMHAKLSKVDKILAIMGIFSNVDEQKTSDYSEEDIRLFSTLEDYIKWFRPFQLSILLALVNAGNKQEFIIQEKESPSALIEAALFDLRTLFTHAQAFYDRQMIIPQKIIIQKSGNNTDDFGKKILEFYHRAIGPDKIDSDYRSYVPYEIITAIESITDPDLVVDLSRDGRIPIVPDGTLRPDILGNESANLSTLRARLKALSIERPGARNTLRPQNPEKRIVDYFARRYLRIPALYHHMDKNNPKQEQRQHEIVKEVLNGNSVFGIMPTGRGKSVVFQLPSILLPGGVIVISPLRALMRDQIEDLMNSRGFNSVETVTSDMEKSDKDVALEDFMQGYTNLLYVSPERLQIKSFQENLAKAATTVHISFFAIDEAHCVSEWGHDFRLSYLHIPEFIEKIKDMQGVRPPIVALTATATIPVRRDVCHILHLLNEDLRRGGNVVAESNIDRPELSFSVHLVEGSSYPDDRQTALKKVLTKSLSAALKHNHNFRWNDFANGNWGKSTGVIFCIYARSAGQTSWQDNVGAVKEFLVKQAAIIPKENVCHYASEQPKFCPEPDCDSLTVRRLTRTERDFDEDALSDKDSYVCSNGHYFKNTVSSPERDWNSYCIETQRRFKKGEFPLLVSTKAYGMGIDNRGLRFINHYGMPSGIEGYYQEAGRAGRDGYQAHCALIVRMPHTQCWQSHVSRIDNQTVADLPCKSKHFLVCMPPYNLPEPCDFARQLRMILQYYIKPEGFASKCAGFWEDLSLRDQNQDNFVTKRVCGGGIQGDYRLQQAQAYLYRLKQLGLIDSFILEYLPHGNHFDLQFYIAKELSISLNKLKNNLSNKLFEIYQATKDEKKKRETSAEDKEKANTMAACMDELLNINEVTQIVVEKSVVVLFSEVRKYVLDMRLGSLKKLMAYINQKEYCRRRDLLGGLDYTHGTVEDTCSLCDVCIPSLEFTQTRADVPKENIQFRDVVASVHSAFGYEDVDQIVTNTVKAGQLKILDTVGMHALTRLEADPYNVAANLAAGIAFASDKNEARRITASGYYQRYAEITNEDKRDFNLAKKGYDHHKKYDKAEAIQSYAVENSAFDIKDAVVLLDEDASDADIPEANKINLKVIRFTEEYKAVTKNLVQDLSKELDNFF